MARMEPRWGWYVAVAVLCGIGTARGAVPSETLLPETTFRFASAPELPKLIEQWHKTQWCQLVEDPVMAPFLKDLRRQFEEQGAGWRELVGLTLDDVRELVKGELALAQLRPLDAQSPPATVLLADVSGNTERAAAVLEKVAASLVQRGAKRAQYKLAGATLSVFELPKQDAKPEAARQVETVAFFLCDDVLGASDNTKALQGVLQHLRGQKGPTLATLPAFEKIMQRLQQDAGATAPQLRWFVRPFDETKPPKAAAAGEKGQGEKGQKGKAALQRAEDLGFSAVQGIGGFVDLAVDPYQAVHRTMIYAPKPYTKALEMLRLPNTEELPTPPWVPRDVAGCTTASLEVLHAFDHFGPVFGTLFGDGEESLWDDVLTGLRDPADPNGPHLDLREELAKNLGNRVHLLTGNVAPIGPNSERLLIAVPLQDVKAVTAGVEKWMKNDSAFEAHPFEKYTIWDAVPPKKGKRTKVSLEAPSSKKADARGAQQAKRDRLFPQAAVAIAQGYLLIASHHDFLVTVLRQSDARTGLSQTVEHQQVSAALKELGAGSNALGDFGRTDEELWPVYELLRKGELPQSQSLLGRLLNSLQKPAKPGQERKPLIDGSQMPEFETVRRYLGPAGAFATSEADGWFIKGAVLSK